MLTDPLMMEAFTWISTITGRRYRVSMPGWRANVVYLIDVVLCWAPITAPTLRPLAPSKHRCRVSGNSDRPSVIIVETLGYGGGNKEDGERRRKTDDKQSYKPADPVKVVGYGSRTNADRQNLTEKQKQKLFSRMLSSGRVYNPSGFA